MIVEGSYTKKRLKARIGVILLLAGAIINFGTFQSSAQTVAINEATRHRIGLVTSTNFVFFDFGIGVGPFLMGFILPLIEFRGLYGGMAAIIFVCILSTILYMAKSCEKEGKGILQTAT